MANGNENKKVNNENVLKMAESALKSANELSNVIAEIQKSTAENASLAANMLVSIQGNSDRIDQVESRAAKM